MEDLLVYSLAGIAVLLLYIKALESKRLKVCQTSVRLLACTTN